MMALHAQGGVVPAQIKGCRATECQLYIPTEPAPCAMQYKENMELRMKHTENPEKFMTSELDLDEEVRR